MNANKNPSLDLTLTLDEVNAILAALQELPARVANPLTQKISEQAKKQLEPAEKVEAEVVA